MTPRRASPPVAIRRIARSASTPIAGRGRVKGDPRPEDFGEDSTGDKAGAHLLGLLDGRRAEEPLELPAELRRTGVPDRPRRRARVVAVVGHQPPRVVEPNPLEVLER